MCRGFIVTFFKWVTWRQNAIVRRAWTSKVVSITLILRPLQFLWMIKFIILDKWENSLVVSDEICSSDPLREISLEIPAKRSAIHPLAGPTSSSRYFCQHIWVYYVPWQFLHLCSMSLWRTFGVLTFRTFIVVNVLLIRTYRRNLGFKWVWSAGLLRGAWWSNDSFAWFDNESDWVVRVLSSIQVNIAYTSTELK